MEMMVVGGGASVVATTNACRVLRRVRCRRIIIAMPPASASRIVFTPQLPYMREQLNQRAFMG